jgi:hypothetical protein
VNVAVPFLIEEDEVMMAPPFPEVTPVRPALLIEPVKFPLTVPAQRPATACAGKANAGHEIREPNISLSLSPTDFMCVRNPYRSNARHLP